MLLLLTALALSAAEAAPGAASAPPDSTPAPGDSTRDAEGTDAPLPLLVDLSLSLGFTAREGEPETSLYQNSDGTWAVSALLQPRGRKLFGSGALALGIEYEVASWLVLTALIDSGELRPGVWLDPPLDGLAADGRPIADAARANAFLRTLSTTFLLGPATVEVGRRRTTLANGLVYDDYGTGLAFRLDFEPMGLGSWSVEAFALLVGDTIAAFENPNPLFALVVDYDLSMFESISLFGALFWDRGALHDVLASAVAERWLSAGAPTAMCDAIEAAVGVPPAGWPVSCLELGLDALFYGDPISTGLLGYAGFSGNLLPVDGLSLRGAFALSFGRVGVDARLAADSVAEDEALAAVAGLLAYQESIGLLGYAGALELHYDLGRLSTALVEGELDLDVGAFGFLISGAQPPQTDGTYNAFIGVAPYWVWTGIFFSGGLNQGFNAGRATAAGVNGRGVVGGGPSVEFGGEPGSIEARAAYLGTLAPRVNGGVTYGIELDFIGRLTVVRWLSLEAEVDLFWPGGFFPTQQTAYRAIAWLNVGYES